MYCCTCVPTDPSLTPTNVMTVMKKGVKDWYYVGVLLHIPRTKLDEIEAAHSSDEDRLTALVSTYLSEHPCPTWTAITAALQNELWGGAAAAEAAAQYVTGESCLYHNN